MGATQNNVKHHKSPLNKNLNKEINKCILLFNKKNKNINKLIHNNISKNFEKSNFSLNFNKDNKSLINISNLVNLIYKENTDIQFNINCNKTIYENIFDFNIIDDYIELNKKLRIKIILILF